ncbi:unnamed protein product [Brassica oleracea var. botrytis]|uniref:Uncharacterized protein n=2 Tax=Brassica TaxID=3705 RepID=A0A0D3BLB7_BRAOL|nr:unnamed protein product [Brassica napus]CDY17479.1 BnaC03g65840D [Brassica napus]
MLNRSPVSYRPNRSQQQLQHTPREYNQQKPLALILGLRSSSLLQQNFLILEDVERKEWSNYVYTLPVNSICEVFIVGVTTTVPKETLSKELKSEVLENTMKLLRLSAQFAAL